MKKILARGGIEFLAVFLGIGLSFYVEQWQTEKDEIELLKVDCKNILSDIAEDIITINNIIDKNQKILGAGRKIISMVIEPASIDLDSLNKQARKLGFPTFYGITRSYKLSYSTGRLNLFADTDLIKEISKLYDHYYERLNINSDVYDKVGLDFFNSFLHRNIGYTRDVPNFDKNEILKFYSSKLFISEMGIFNRRVSFYLARLSETNNQLLIVKKQLEQYLS